ncbi:putative DPH-type metal-binding domain-containing protein [Helianthus annuus]|nr:putative DPH-type metal-binding domain-containing protein [Helianthus annuus]
MQLAGNPIRRTHYNVLNVKEDATQEEIRTSFFYQCRCGDYFSLDSSELGEMGFELLMKGDKVSLQTHNTADMASIVLPCGSCSLKIRLMISKD